MTQFPLKIFRFFIRAGIFFITFSFLLVLVLRWLPVSYTPLMFIRLCQHNEKEKKIDHQWVGFKSIPDNLELAVVCCEDQRFLLHHGFDLEEIERASKEAEDGGRTRGASTISQQTAKNVFLWPSSTYVRKGFEVWFTLLIEFLWGKKRIMEVYLNSIEFGNGIYGCGSAAEHFFHKDVSLLSNAEAARLAVVLPNPLGMKADAASGIVINRMTWALGQMKNYGNKIDFDKGGSPLENTTGTK
ncbi:MAG: monofunctional biosynthetic peptidoglycan transglycosylase [Bacteroidetes bacterium]|nr:monofunctional biosynthetic peptidoglycan transglycosylase [Bacteroidota bacterium]